MSVLIVDDHEMFRVRARTIAESAGYNVIGEAEDAAGALAQVHELRPNVVLLDIQLPDGDGFAVAEQLDDEPNPPIVVLISSRDAKDFGSKLDETSALGFIQKDDLSGARLRELLGNAG